MVKTRLAGLNIQVAVEMSRSTNHLNWSLRSHVTFELDTCWSTFFMVSDKH